MEQILHRLSIFNATDNRFNSSRFSELSKLEISFSMFVGLVAVVSEGIGGWGVR